MHYDTVEGRGVHIINLRFRLTSYARRFIARIIASVENLADFPDIGREVPEAEEREDVRELIFQSYRIIYLRQSTRIYIVTVIHGSRDLSGMDDKPWDVG